MEKTPFFCKIVIIVLLIIMVEAILEIFFKMSLVSVGILIHNLSHGIL